MIPHGDLLGERARLTPDKTALVYVPTGERFTYAELDARAMRWARLWRQGLGLQKGDRVAFLADNRPEVLDAFFAAPKSGVILVPLGTRLTPREMAGILEDAAPKAFFYGSEHADKVRELRGMIDLPRWVSLDGELDGLLEDGPWTRESGGPEDLWCLLYTSEDGREVPPGEVGELLLRGPHVCRGYWNNPEATAAALDADGWFHTGDLARRDEKGFHWIAGRKKDMIISGGVNVYPAEIEGELVLHPGVRDAAVVGVPHPTWGEMGVAYIVAESADTEPPTAEALAEFLAGRLAKYKIPREFRFVESLPRTAYGKVVKGELRQQYVEGLC